jgi:hypothetical protein
MEQGAWGEEGKGEKGIRGERSDVSKSLGHYVATMID